MIDANYFLVLMHTILNLININPSKFGAVEEYALWLSYSLNKKNIGIVAFTYDPPKWIKKKYEDLGIAVCNVPYSVSSLKFFKNLRSIIKKYQVNILHVTFFPTYSLNLILSTLGTQCHLIHSDQCSRTSHTKSHIFEFVKYTRNKLFQKFIYTVIADAEFIRSCQIKDMHMSPVKIKVIYNGVNLNRFYQENDANTSPILKEFDLPTNSKIIASIAQLIPEKGLNYLIEAAAYLVKRNSNLYFFLIGEGRQRDEFEVMVSQLGLQDNIIFTGLRSDTESFLAVADIFVLLSVWEEAFAFSLLEAMAAHCPVVASRTGAIPESVIHGETGLLVPPRDGAAAAQAIQYLLDHNQEREQMGIAARKRVEDHFSLERWVSETIQLYEEILQN